MTTKNKLLLATSALFSLLCLGSSFYYAWEEGLLPTGFISAHPRAPLPENFLRTLQENKFVTSTLRPACVNFNIYPSRKIDRESRDGLRYFDMPGWGVRTIAQVPSENGQRIGEMTQAFEILSKAGLYKSDSNETEDENGQKLPARSYSLTVEGWKNKLDSQCLKIGTQRIIEITEFSRILPDKDGQRIYEIKAKYAPQDIPAWVNDPSLVAAISQNQITKAREAVTTSFRLIRTNTGWSVVDANDVPELSKEAILNLVETSYANSKPRGCIRLPSKSEVPNIEVALAPYSVTFFDIDMLHEIEKLPLVMQWQSRFSELEKAGLVKSEKVSADSKLGTSVGTKFRIEPAFQAQLDMNDSRCLNIGSLTAELIDLRFQHTPNLNNNAVYYRAASQIIDNSSNLRTPFLTTAKAKFLFRLNRDAWINKVQLSLPEVDAIKEAGGIPMMVNLSYDSQDNKEKKWRVTSIEVPNSDPVPPRLRRTTLIDSTRTPATSSDALHAIGVYEGKPPPNIDSRPWWAKCNDLHLGAKTLNSEQQKMQQMDDCHSRFARQSVEKEVVVNISDSTRPMVLALMAYDRTHWKIKLNSGVRIKKIILSGYHSQRVSGISGNLAIETYTHESSPCPRCIQGGRSYFYSYEAPPKELSEITGLRVTSFQGKYKGDTFSIFPGIYSLPKIQSNQN